MSLTPDSASLIHAFSSASYKSGLTMIRLLQDMLS